MERETERKLAAHAVELGRRADPAVLPELIALLDTLDYKIGMLIKQQMYQHAGKRLISLYPRDKPNLDAILSGKLLRITPTDSASAPSTLGVGVATRSKPDNLTQKGTTNEKH